jgi:hypothetical protein
LHTAQTDPDDAIYCIHTALSHLDKKNTYVRMLFIDYSSVFNTIGPSKLITKLRILGLNTSLCNLILDFLTGCPQVVRVGSKTSATLILITGAPQGCVLIPLLYSLLTHSCMVRHNSNTIIKFAKDTTVVGLTTDKTAYRMFSLLPHGKRYRSAKSSTKSLRQFLPRKHKTPEQVIKWLPGIFALSHPPPPSFTLLLLCLSYMHSHFNHTYMYILPKLAQLTGACI